MSAIDNFEKYIETWIETLDKPVNDGNYNGKQCPYAKNIWQNNKIKIVKIRDFTLDNFWSTISLECEKFDNTYEMVICGAETNIHVLNGMQLSGGVEAINSTLNVRNKDLWLVAQFGEIYSIVNMQTITGLDSQSKILQEKQYYNNRYNDYMFDIHVLRRRKMREKLDKKQ
tara:strand:+ start:114 stop:626 length:513 start_codon:yes stop_codon:yes gene_type:complete